MFRAKFPLCRRAALTDLDLKQDLKQNCKYATKIASKLSQNCELNYEQTGVLLT